MQNFVIMVHMNGRKKNYLILFLLTTGTIATGTFFYHFIEGFRWVDSYYFTVGTMFTVGYGDLAPETDFGKVFTTVYMIIGVGIIGGFVKSAMQYRVSHSRIATIEKEIHDSSNH